MRAHGEETTNELRDAIRAYEEQRPGRGADFIEAVGSVLQRIREAPLSFPRVPGVRRPIVRKAKVLRFPYSVLYYVHRGEPIVVAFAHGKRVPAYWRRRIA